MKAIHQNIKSKYYGIYKKTIYQDCGLGHAGCWLERFIVGIRFFSDIAQRYVESRADWLRRQRNGSCREALNADPNVVLSAMADAFSDRLEQSYATLKAQLKEKVQVSNDHKFVGLDAYQKLIDSDVDVVLLAAPPAFRPLHLEAAVNAGKHIFCEKPFAVDAPGLRRVMAAAKEAETKRLSLVSGFCWRYHLPKRETFKRVLNGQIGEFLRSRRQYRRIMV